MRSIRLVDELEPEQACIGLEELLERVYIGFEEQVVGSGRLGIEEEEERNIVDRRQVGQKLV